MVVETVEPEAAAARVGLEPGAGLCDRAAAAASPTARAWVLERHGATLAARGRLLEAATTYDQALALQCEGSLGQARSQHSRGTVALELGDLTNVERPLGEAVALRERLAPDSLGLAATLQHLGQAARDRGDLAEAEQLLGRAQHDLIGGPIAVDQGGTTVERDLSHPVHWSAFELVGDWR